MNLAILGTRGIPAGHGGFETLAERLALYLVKKGWNVTVYCQVNGQSKISEEFWEGVRLINIPVKSRRSIHSILFDLKSMWHAAGEQTLVLSLGYGTSIFWPIFKWKHVINICNMDGMEWHRKKWIFLVKIWLRINEKAAAVFADHLIADSPVIYDYLSKSVNEEKLTMIPYGAYHITSADEGFLAEYGLEAGKYILTICRIEEDNSLLEIVAGYQNSPREEKLVIVGGVDFDNDRYHKKLMALSGSDVIYLGPIYDQDRVSALRKYTRLYVHGHTVGGTNPSLVEAMGAELPILARDNMYNRWVAGPNNHYFTTVVHCGEKLDLLLKNDVELTRMKNGSYSRFEKRFRWEKILSGYEKTISRFI